MSLYKTGHRDYPSLSVYSSLVEKHGPESDEAMAYLNRFLDDISFVKQAEAIRLSYNTNNSQDKGNE